MGWNRAFKQNQFKDSKIFTGIEDCSFFYFVHSYFGVPDDTGVIATTTEYGIKFASSIIKDNISAFQFHPEKSHNKGLQILSNWLKEPGRF